MKFINDDEITPPPGIFSSIKSGFDATANRIWIILFPVLLDLFLWLGPRLRVDQLLQKVIEQFDAFAQEGLAPATEVQRIQESLNELLSLKINIFSLLRTFPIGVSSIMGQTAPSGTPLGESAVYQVESAFTFFLWVGGLTLIGWVLGSIYFAWVARASLDDKELNLSWAGNAVIQATLLALFWLIVLFAFGTPLLLLFSIFAQINAGLAQIALIILALFAMWIIVPIFFSAHGIFTKKENLFHSLLSSFHLSRFTLPTSSFFVISTIILSQGFNFLWLTPSASSWMMLVSIFGHAFITTALLASSFIYYRDMNVWLEVVLKKLDSKTTSAQA